MQGNCTTLEKEVAGLGFGGCLLHLLRLGSISSLSVVQARNKPNRLDRCWMGPPPRISRGSRGWLGVGCAHCMRKATVQGFVLSCDRMCVLPLSHKLGPKLSHTMPLTVCDVFFVFLIEIFGVFLVSPPFVFVVRLSFGSSRTARKKTVGLKMAVFLPVFENREEQKNPAEWQKSRNNVKLILFFPDLSWCTILMPRPEPLGHAAVSTDRHNKRKSSKFRRKSS